MNSVLSIDNLSKSYGQVKAVQNLSFSVEKGSVFGILGPNGSGKTTTLGMLLGVLQPDAGNFSWFGKAPAAESLKKIGAILETPNFFPYLSGIQNLRIVADIKEVPYSRIDPVLEQVNLSNRGKDNFKNYSLGMKQRLALGAALLNQPEVLVLDEPTNGLDPQGIAEVRQLITQIAQDGTTILLASHLLDEVEKVCTDVAILKSGQLLFSGPVSEILTGSGSEYVELNAPDIAKLKAALQQHPEIENLINRAPGLVATFTRPITGVELNDYLHQQGVTLGHLAVRQKSLETQFLELTSKNKAQ